MKKIIIILTVLIVAGMGITAFYLNSSVNTGVKEIRNPKTNVSVEALRAPFDLQDTITGSNGAVNTYVFQGHVEDIKEYEVQWSGEDGMEFGPRTVSILEVQIIKDYYGERPVDSDRIRVYYPSSVACTESDSVKIDKDRDYIFANCWVIDEKYFSSGDKQAISPYWSDNPAFEMVDVLSGSAWCSLFPIEDGIVYSYHGYFESIDNISDFILAPEEAKSTLLTSDDALTSGDFIALRYSDFEYLFQQIISENRGMDQG